MIGESTSDRLPRDPVLCMLILSRPRASYDSGSGRRFGSEHRDLSSGCDQDQVAGSEVFTGSEGLRRGYR